MPRLRCCAGTGPQNALSAVNIRDSGEWITISADEQHLRHFLDSAASTDATLPFSGLSTLTAAEGQEDKGQLSDVDGARLTEAHPELHLQQFLDSSASTNTNMLSTMYTTAHSSAAAGQLPQQACERGALPKRDTRQSPQMLLPGEISASGAEIPAQMQQASQSPGNITGVRPAGGRARAPHHPVQMPLQRPPPGGRHMTRQPAPQQSPAKLPGKVPRGGTTAALPSSHVAKSNASATTRIEAQDTKPADPASLKGMSGEASDPDCVQVPANTTRAPRFGNTRQKVGRWAGAPTRDEGVSMWVPVGTALAAGSATVPKQDGLRSTGAAPASGLELTRSQNAAQQPRSPWRPVSAMPEETLHISSTRSGMRQPQPPSTQPVVWRPVGPSGATGRVLPKEGSPMKHTVTGGPGELPRTRRPRDRDLKLITQDMQTLLDNRHQKYEAEVLASVTAGERLLAEAVRLPRRYSYWSS